MFAALCLPYVACATLLGSAHDADPGAAELEQAVGRAVEILVERQESLDGAEVLAEWPYEGVYRERGDIPIGYRVGGTSIVAWSLLETPHYAGSEEVRAAVRRALEFVLTGLAEDAMSVGFSRSYDVRGWGHIYALTFLLRMRALERVPDDLEPAVAERVDWLVNALCETEIVETGGWNYSRRGGFNEPAPASPFMTAPAVLALWEAERQGFSICADVVERALDALEAGRAEDGSMSYTSKAGKPLLPGAIARTPVTEVVLLLAGRSERRRITTAVEDFFTHWEELEKRRQQTGTHVAPYGVAPYYFFYGHYYIAFAIEMLPEAERSRARERYLATLFSVREDSGGWNDRVFDRSEAYGTAMALLSMIEPGRPRPGGALPVRDLPVRDLKEAR